MNGKRTRAEFYRTWASLLEVGVNHVKTLDTLAGMYGGKWRKRIIDAREVIRQGEGLEQVLKVLPIPKDEKVYLSSMMEAGRFYDGLYNMSERLGLKRFGEGLSPKEPKRYTTKKED